MVGIGAVAGAIVIPRVRATVGSARLVTGAMAATAVAIAVIATVGYVVVVGDRAAARRRAVDRGDVAA